MGIHLMESTGVMSRSVPLMICVSPYHWDLRWLKIRIPYNRSVSNKTCILSDREFYVFIEIAVFGVIGCNGVFLKLFFGLESSQALSS